jgi:NADH-quinone oxidoreductase subunit B
MKSYDPEKPWDLTRLPTTEAPEGSVPHAPTMGENSCFAGADKVLQAPKLQEAVATIKNWFRAGSLNVVSFGTGCGYMELRPLATSRFDMSRFGITGAPTPRQANVFIISGYLSTKTLKRVIRTYEQMPNPKWVVALGSCTINGGMYWDSYNTIKVLDLYMPVDIYIAGCMPRPEALIAGFQSLMEDIKGGGANGWHHYLENLDWYRENQKKVFPDWDLPDYSW